MQSTINLTSSKLRSVLIFRVLWTRKMQLFRLARVKVIVNYWRLVMNLFHPLYGQKACFYWRKLLRKISRYCSSFSGLPSFFEVKKQRHKIDFGKYYRRSVSIEVSLELKVCFPRVTWELNNEVALRSIKWITEISSRRSNPRRWFEYKTNPA